MASPSNNVINLGLLETFIPISSILTVCVAVGYILPRHQTLGLFILVWWWTSVVFSLSCSNGWLIASPTGWSTGDGWSLLILIGYNVLILGFLWLWFHRTKSSIRPFILQKIPLWSLIALHIYRLDGLSIVMAYINGKVPSFVGFQTMVLDVWIGGAAIPLAILLHPKFSGGVDRISHNLRNALWLWNSLGLYDLCSAYLILILNWANIGGSWIAEPPLSRIGFHPFPLLLLFQVPLAIAIHVLCLTQIEALIDQQQSLGQLPLHVRRIRALKY